MGRTIVQLIETEQIYTYGIGGAPRIEGAGSGRLRVQPYVLRLSVRDNALSTVTITGPTIRSDGKWGMHRAVMWTQGEKWAGMPPWVAEIINNSPLKSLWEAPS